MASDPEFFTKKIRSKARIFGLTATPELCFSCARFNEVSKVSGVLVGSRDNNRLPNNLNPAQSSMLPRNLSTFFRVLQVTQTFKRHAGHSKWANIKHIKAVKDAQKSMIFTRLSRQMKVAIQEGGSPNPDMNLKLSQIIEQAKRANMPAGTIQSVIKSVQARKEDCKSGIIEIKGPKGVIILCEIFSNNYQRCKMDIATVIKKHNASFSDGGGRHIFDKKGLIETNLLDSKSSEEQILELAIEHAIESGAEDVKLVSEDTLQFVCEPGTLKTVQTNLENLKYVITSASIEYVPSICVNLSDDDLEKLSVMFDKLENCEEVIKLYDNIG